MKYANAQEFVIETQHGVYPIGEWSFCACRATLEEAIKFIRDRQGYRIVDRNGTPVVLE